ncbi:MAG: T9SS type A sorting domain-containing protein [Bacteroidota bacterium]|jgi:photosystem II stability/assembly factor-like uncharacterized protein
MKFLFFAAMLFSFSLSVLGQWEIVEQSDDCIYHSVYFINDSVGFVTGSCNQIDVVLKTSNFGNNWYQVHSEEINYFYDIYFPTDTIGYISAYTNVLKTIDGGETWFYPNSAFEGYPYRSIVFQNEEIGFGCFADGGAAFATTTDGGYTWIEDYTYGGRELLKLNDCQIRMISGNYRKSDNCWSEHETLFADVGNRTISNFAMNSYDSIVVCGIGLNDETLQNFGFVATSTNEGLSWSVYDFEFTNSLNSVVYVNPSTAFCVGQGNYPQPYSFLKSIDGGTTWLYQIYDFPCGTCFSPEVRDVYCPSENVCYAVSGGGTIWRTLNGGGEIFPLPVGVVESKAKVKLELFPNPSTGELNIVSNDNIESIQLFNSLGQVVLLSSCSLVANSHKLSVSSLECGIYYLIIQTVKGTSIQSFVKE